MEEAKQMKCYKINSKSFTTPLSRNSQKRLEHKENHTKYRNMTRKPRIHVRILIYRTWAKNRKNCWKEDWERVSHDYLKWGWEVLFWLLCLFYDRILIIQVNTHGNKNCLVIETAYWCRLNCKLLVLIFNFLILWLYFRSVKWYNEREKSGQVVERLYSHLHRYRPHRQLAFYRLKELHFR